MLLPSVSQYHVLLGREVAHSTFCVLETRLVGRPWDRSHTPAVERLRRSREVLPTPSCQALRTRSRQRCTGCPADLRQQNAKSINRFIWVRPRESQWRRSVVKYGGQGQSGQAIKLFQITHYVNDFQTFNNPSSWQPVGNSKNYVCLPFWHKSFIHWWCEICSYPTTLAKNVTF